MDIEKLNVFDGSLTPREQKAFHKLLNTIGDINALTRKIGEANLEYMKIYKVCSETILHQLDKRTHSNKDEIMHQYNYPFMEICKEYDAIGDETKKHFKKWDECTAYGTEIFRLIITKGKSDKVMKGIQLLLEDNIKQLNYMENYYKQILIMTGKIKEFKKKLGVFIN